MRYGDPQKDQLSKQLHHGVSCVCGDVCVVIAPSFIMVDASPPLMMQRRHRAL